MDEPTRRRLSPHVPDLMARWHDFVAGRGEDLDAFVHALVAQGFVEREVADEVLSGAVRADDGATITLETGRSLGTWDGGGPAAPDGLDDLPGRGLLVVGRAGEGAMGEVLIATDRDLERTVAFKVIGKGHANDPRAAARFYAEARITARLDHPGVVPIHALARSDDGRLGYTMKRVEGRTLGGWLELRRPLEERLEVFLKICDAVEYAHHRGVVHRDLKPENVMVGDHGEVWVMDWGIARSVDEPPEPGTGLVGTVGFMSPEQAGGRLDVDARSDQYALGVILQELVTLADATPSGTSLQRLAANQTGRRPPMVHRLGERVPVELVAIVDRATAVDPARRYPEVEALADDLRRFLRGDAVHARPDTPWMALLRWTGKHRRTVLAALVLAVLGGVGGVGWVEAARLGEREEAARAEQALTALLARRAAQAARIDARLVRYQGLAETVAATAAERWLRGAPVEGPTWFAPTFDLGHGPPDVAYSEFYGMPVSLGHAVLLLPEPARPEDIEGARRLAPLVGLLRDGMLRSGALQPAFLSVATESGVLLSYPGHGGFPPGYDARERPWYTVARDAEGAVWGAPYADSGGMGLLLPCSAPIRDGDELVGVASIKLAVAQVIGDLLESSEGEAFVVDAEGDVIVRTRPSTEPAPAVLAAIRAGEPGPHVDGSGPDREVTSWHPLPDLGWTYIVRGRRSSVRE